MKSNIISLLMLFSWLFIFFCIFAVFSPLLISYFGLTLGVFGIVLILIFWVILPFAIGEI